MPAPARASSREVHDVHLSYSGAAALVHQGKVVSAGVSYCQLNPVLCSDPLVH